MNENAEFLVVQKLTRKFSSKEVVKGISFAIKAGEIFGLLGINGAGKTTTLRIISGIIKGSSGIVKIDNRILSPDSYDLKSLVGYIPDRPHLYPKLTVIELLTFVGHLYQLSKTVIKERSSMLLAEFSLEENKDSRIEHLSHGMKQRLSTCAALLHSPKLLVIDEPMVGLDPHGALFLRNKLRACANNGMAILLSTHTLSVAEVLCDRFGIMDRGALVLSGTLAELQQANGNALASLETIFLAATGPSTNYGLLEGNVL